MVQEKMTAAEFRKSGLMNKRQVARHKSGEMNRTEAEYASDFLEPLKQSGFFVEYWFEEFTFKLAPDTRYTPDFVALRSDGKLEVHETKGSFVRDDALVKFKVAAARYPFIFWLCQKLSKKQGGGWQIKQF
jgi:hypothetical protein